jgi:hypothetical protein
MPERERWPDEALARALHEAGEWLDAPEDADVSAAVAARLGAAPAPSRGFAAGLRLGWQPVPTVRRALLLAAALLLLLAVAATAAEFAVRGVRITFTSTPPTVVPAPSPVPFAQRLNLGDRVTLDRARSAVAFPVRVPSPPGLGAPDAVFLDEYLPGGQVSFVYRPSAGLPATAGSDVGLLVTEFRGSLSRPLLNKVLGPGTQLTEVRVNGAPGYFISGSPHEVMYLAPNGQIDSDTVRLAGNVLLWQSGGVTIRLEGDMSQADALAIARSIR